MGFLALVDSIFLASSICQRQARHAVCEKADPPVTEEKWFERFDQITRRKGRMSSWLLEGRRVWLLGTWLLWGRGPSRRRAAGGDDYANEMLFLDDLSGAVKKQWWGPGICWS